MRIGINGFGRIGRLALRTALQRHAEIEVVAVNDLFDVATAAHLLKHDSTYGAFPGLVEVDGTALVVDGRRLDFTSQRDWTELAWGERGIELVIEATGIGTRRGDAEKHLVAGAKKVLISAPAKDPDVTLVLGVNGDRYDPEKHHIISNASCTTNGLAPVVKVVRDELGLVKGMMTTVHSYTNSQKILDVAAPDLREARAGALNIVPTSTGAAKAVALVIPEVAGALDGLAYRVPTPTVSIVELVALVERDTTVDEVNAALRRAAAGPMKGILAVTDEPLVSMDLKGNEHSSIVDSLVTGVVGGNLVKVAAWYDNEWGYACRIADLAALVAARAPALATA
ncbi:MAG TPA: type I glyceraldehyde-3-phosphate dehydrogenase [Chloroflexota bacterium]|nr:type I glyceraldehyde-3-phosphate dehydrogenase [Chloroflexota bacterium]